MLLTATYYMWFTHAVICWYKVTHDIPFLEDLCSVEAWSNEVELSATFVKSRISLGQGFHVSAIKIYSKVLEQSWQIVSCQKAFTNKIPRET